MKLRLFHRSYLTLRFDAELLLAVDAAVAAARRQCKNMVAALLDGGNAARVRAFDDIDQALGLLGANLLHHMAVTDDRDRNFGVNIGKNVKALV